MKSPPPARSRVASPRRKRGGGTGREGRPAVDAAPVEAQPRLEREALPRLPAVLQPRPEAGRVHRRVEVAREPRPALHARAVRRGRVAVPLDEPGRLRAQLVDLEARLDEVGPRRPGQLLAQREVSHPELAGEVDVGEVEAHVVARGVGAARLVAELRLRADVVAVHVVGGDRPGGHAAAEEGRELQGREVVARRGHEVALLPGAVALEEGVGRLAAEQAEEGQAGPGAQVPVEPALDVAEGRELGAHQAVRDEVVVRPARGHDPGALLLSRQPALEDGVGVGEAHGRRTAEPLRVGARSVLDDEERGEPVAVLRGERPGVEVEPADGLGVERARQAEEAVRVVDLHPVHDREVLVRGAPAHGDAAVELRGGRDPGQGLQGAEDVVRGAGDGHDRGRPHRELGRRLGLPRPLRHDLHLLLEPLLHRRRRLLRLLRLAGNVRCRRSGDGGAFVSPRPKRSHHEGQGRERGEVPPVHGSIYA